MDFVTANLAVGSRHIDAERCKRNGITHVLSVRSAPDEIEGVVCLHNPMRDEGQDMPPEYWLRTVLMADRILTTPSAKLYVHCSAGVNRGPANTYAILRAVLGFSAEEAWGMLRTARRQVGKGNAVYHGIIMTAAEFNIKHGLPEAKPNRHMSAYMASIDRMIDASL